MAAESLPNIENNSNKIEKPKIQSNEFFDKLNSLRKFVKGNLTNAQLGLGENKRDMTNSCVVVERFLNDILSTLGEDEPLRQEVVNLKKIDIFSPTTEYDSVNKILHIAPGDKAEKIKEVLDTAINPTSAPNGLAEELIQELHKDPLTTETTISLDDEPEEPAVPAKDQVVDVQSEPKAEPQPEPIPEPVVEPEVTPEPAQAVEQAPVVEKPGVNGKTFEQMVAEIDLLQKNNGEYIKNKTWRKVTGAVGDFANRTIESETTRSILASKIIQRYMGLSRGQRMAVNFTLGTAAGFAVGSAASIGVAGYGAARLARFGASFGGSTLGTAIAEKRENWKEDTVKAKEDEEIKIIKGFGFTPEKEAEELAKVTEKYEKERRNIKLKKMAMAVGFGAGVGALEGFGEHIFHNMGGASKVAEALTNKPKLDHVVGPKNASVHENIANVSTSPRLSGEEVKNIVDMAPATPKATGIKLSPESLIVTPKHGDGLWNLLKHPLEQNPEFTKLSPAQQQSVLSFYTNKAIAKPGDFGLVADAKFGVKIDAGKDLDLSKLMGDTEQLQRVIAKASKLGEEAQKKIIDSSTRIAEYAKTHQGASTTVEKVNEVAIGKPSAEAVMPIPKPHEDIVVDMHKQPESMFVAKSKVAGGGNNLNQEVYSFRRPEDVEPVVDKSTTPLTRGNSLDSVSKPRSMFADSVDIKQVKMGVEQGVNNVYTDNGIFFKTQGIDTKEWGLMKALNAKQVLQYMKHDSLDAGLKPEIVESLTSKNHMKFLSELDGLMKQTKITDAQPNERVEDFLGRLVKAAIKAEADKATQSGMGLNV